MDGGWGLNHFLGRILNRLRWQTAEPLALTAALKWAKSLTYKADDTQTRWVIMMGWKQILLIKEEASNCKKQVSQPVMSSLKRLKQKKVKRAETGWNAAVVRYVGYVLAQNNLVRWCLMTLE